MATYEGLTTKAEKLKLVLREKEFEHMDHLNNLTGDVLCEMHLANMEANIRNGLWDKHGPMSFGLQGIGKGKAVIAIGAGPSFKKNSATLKQVHDFNFMKDIDDQPFLFVSCNHQWKACMKMGIYPHFVQIVDAGDVLFRHLCEDVPETAQNTILLTGLHCSPKTLEEWDRQGRQIQFYVPNFERKQELFKELTKEDPANFCCEEGGNVLNMAWIIARKFMHSDVFMTVGNDLCYPIIEDPLKRRQAYYADGDYRANVENKKDEARNKKAWIGFDMEYNDFIQADQMKLKPFWTSHQLWAYKKWMETQVCLCEAESDKSFHYYNCSEMGILGMVAKDLDGKALNDPDNWVLMDNITPKRWHTRRLRSAVGQFLKARDLWLKDEKGATLYTAGDAASLVDLTATAAIAAQSSLVHPILR